MEVDDGVFGLFLCFYQIGRFDLHTNNDDGITPMVIVSQLHDLVAPAASGAATASPSRSKEVLLSGMKQSMSSQVVVSALRSQYRAALETLEQCIDMIDEDAWAAMHPDTAVNQVVFHTLFFADLYLGFGESGFRHQPFHRDNPQLFQDYEELDDRVQKNFYSQEGCRAYLEHCRKKVDATLKSEDAAVLSGDCGFPYRKLSRIELHIYNVRHIQHHAAQLGLRNQLDGRDPLRWVAKGQ